MTTITIKNGEKLSRDSFENWEDFQTEFILLQTKSELSKEHIEILESREKEADKATDKGLSWEEIRSNITRHHV